MLSAAILIWRFKGYSKIFKHKSASPWGGRQKLGMCIVRNPGRDISFSNIYQKRSWNKKELEKKSKQSYLV